jgi:hypothetical protein
MQYNSGKRPIYFALTRYCLKNQILFQLILTLRKREHTMMLH